MQALARAQECATMSEIKARPLRSFELSGTLRKEWFWGPPNFGENPKTDRHNQDFVLLLDYPLLSKNYPYGQSRKPD